VDGDTHGNSTAGVAPGWYPDPAGRFDARFHNGRSWTADVSTDGERYIDPLGAAPVTTTPPSGDGSNGPATAAMVLGIVSLATGWLPFVVVVGAITALLALVTGTIGLRRARRTGSGRARAVAGLVTGGAGMLACVLGVVFTVVVLQAIDRYENPEPHEVRITSCELTGSSAELTGELTNLGTRVADFSVVVAFVRPGTDNAHRTVRIPVEGLAPDERTMFETRRDIGLEGVECIVVDVDGPLPFGVALD
jgi:hypothetical protein